MIFALISFFASVFLPDRVVVSDTNAFTCASAPMSQLSADGSRIFSNYLTSRTGYGEAHDIVALVDVPIDNPSASTNHVICHAGEKICGLKVDEVDSYDVFLFKGKVRCVIGINGGLLGWRDWNPATGEVCGEGMFKCRIYQCGATEPLTPILLTRYLNEKGFVGHAMTRTYRDQLITHSHACWVGGAFYGTLTSSLSQPIVFRCTDGETLELLGVVPTLCEYECALSYLNGTFYAFGRKMPGDNFYVSNDGCRTFRSVGRLPDGEQRPQLTVWKDRLLIAFSAPDEKPNNIRNGRNNIHLLWGEGANLGRYRELLHEIDPLGIVYYDIVPRGDELHVLWSDARRFPDKVIWGAVQGKDRILYGKLSSLLESRASEGSKQ